MSINSKHHVWIEPSTAHLLQRTILKVKCAGSSLMLWVCFSAVETEGLIRVNGKLNSPTYWDSLNETPVQSIQNLRLAEASPFNRTVTLNTQQEWFIDNSVNVFEWPSHSLRLNPIKYFWRNLKMSASPHPTWQSLRGEEVRRRMPDNCQLQMCKAYCHIIYKKTWGCKDASAKYWVKLLMQCTYFSVLFLTYMQSCHKSVFAMPL